MSLAIEGTTGSVHAYHISLVMHHRQSRAVREQSCGRTLTT